MEREEFYSPVTTFKKSNSLIRGRFTANLFENKLLSISLANVKNDDDNRLRAILNKTQVRKLMGAETHTYYNTLKLSARRLLHSIIMAEDPETKKFKASVLVTDVEYAEGEGTIVIIFNETFRKQILDIKNKFTPLNLNVLCKLDRNGTYRLYETLRSYSYYPDDYKGKKDGKFTKEYGLSELRCMLNCVDLTRDDFSSFFDGKKTPDYDKVCEYAKNLYLKEKELGIPKKDRYPAPKYEKWGELKREIIDPSIEEMQEKTELEVTYETITEGRSHKVTGVKFYIYDRNYDNSEKIEVVPVPAFSLEALEELDEGIQDEFTLKEIKYFYSDAGGDIGRINKAYKVYKNASSVKNRTAYMRKAIMENMEPEAIPKKKKHFENQRDYDFAELEAMLLNK